jgi:hypothetical protein
MWLVVLPVAEMPLWQLEQPLVMPAWLKVFAQVVVTWQLSQAAVVAMWVGPLPMARVPLWQDAQLPSTCA